MSCEQFTKGQKIISEGHQVVVGEIRHDGHHHVVGVYYDDGGLGYWSYFIDDDPFSPFSDLQQLIIAANKSITTSSVPLNLLNFFDLSLSRSPHPVLDFEAADFSVHIF